MCQESVRQQILLSSVAFHLHLYQQNPQSLQFTVLESELCYHQLKFLPYSLQTQMMNGASSWAMQTLLSPLNHTFQMFVTLKRIINYSRIGIKLAPTG